MHTLPKIRTRMFSEKITVPVEPELRRALQDLKEQHSVDTMEICRQAIRRAIQEAEKLIEKAS